MGLVFRVREKSSQGGLGRGRGKEAAAATLPPPYVLPCPSLPTPSCPGDSLSLSWVVRPPPGSVCPDIQGPAAGRADLGED